MRRSRIYQSARRTCLKKKRRMGGALLLRLALLTWLFVITPALWWPQPPASSSSSSPQPPPQAPQPAKRSLRFLDRVLPTAAPTEEDAQPPAKEEETCAPIAGGGGWCGTPWLLPALGALHALVPSFPRAFVLPPHLRAVERAVYLAALQATALIGTRLAIGADTMRVVALHAAVRYAQDVGTWLPDARPFLAMLVIAEAPLCHAAALSSWEHFLGWVAADACSDALTLLLP